MNTRTEKKDKEEIIELIKTLVQIPSYMTVEGGETRVAEKILEIALSEGLEGRLEEVTKGRSNVEIILKGQGEGKTILFCGHMDTVNTDGMEIEPLQGYIKDGKMWGRGTVDMKGGLASMLYALIYLKRNKIKIKGQVILIGTVGEECPRNSDGAYKLRERGKFADIALIGEATNLNIAVAHKGTISLEIEIKGKAAHSSNPKLGDNAIYKGIDLIYLIKNQLIPKLEGKQHKICGEATLNVGMIKGGLQNNIVPASCSFSLNRRYIPGETEEGIIKEIKNLWQTLPYAEEDMTIYPLEETENRIPLETDENKAFIKTLMNSAAKFGVNSKIYGANYWTDGAHLGAVGIPTVVFGPGDIKEAHGAVEFIELEEVYKGLDIYIDFILSINGG